MVIPVGARAQVEPGAAPQPPAAPPAPAPAPAPAPPGQGEPPGAPVAETDAPAEEVVPEPQAPRIRVGGRNLTHYLQFGASATPGVGYRVIFPYDDKKDCGDSSGDAMKRVCTNKLPWFIDLEPSFGVSKHVDILVGLRFGLEADHSAAEHKQFALMPGFRYWVDPNEAVKFYTTVQVTWDHTPQSQNQIKTDDLAFHNVNGFMYDFVKNFGLYLHFGETIGFIRWLRFELEVGGGIQLRVP